MTDFVPTFRRTTYDAINPTKPSNTQKGRTVCVIGASEGIGFNIAQAYAHAGADKLILCSRSQHKLDQAKASLTNDPRIISCEIHTYPLDTSSPSSIDPFWTALSRKNLHPSTLILSAAAIGPGTSASEISTYLQTNVTAKVHLLELFRNQTHPADQQRQKILIDISSAGFHCYPYPLPGYCASKVAFTTYLCHLADTLPESEMRMVSLHPGAVYTSAASNAGEYPRDLPFWDDESLSAHVAVWLSSAEAAFLHGRFVWANWDVDELMQMREKIAGDASLLRVGVTGVEGYGVRMLVDKCKQFPVR